MVVEDLGLMRYEPAWERQRAVHDEVLRGGTERLLLVEHPPVITLGRRAGCATHVTASGPQLADLKVELVHSDRGGDVTFHGPGQVVAYPIIRLIDHRLSVGGYVQRLEQAVVDALGVFDVHGYSRRSGAVGVWVDDAQGEPAKICSIGVRITRGVSLHGLALNVTTDLRYFNLIVPCGLSGCRVTSMAEVRGAAAPSLAEAKQAVADSLMTALEAVALEG